VSSAGVGTSSLGEVLSVEAGFDRVLVDQRVDQLVEDLELRVTPALCPHVGQHGRCVALKRPVVGKS